MKSRIIFLVVFFITINVTNAQEYAGAELVTSVDLGVDNLVWNFSTRNDTIYMTVYDSDQLLKFSTISNEIATGYPVSLTNGTAIHGNYVDNNDILWVFDLNNSRVNKYAPDHSYIESVNVGSQPVSGIEIDGKLYVVDRDENKIYIVNMETLVIENSFEINIMGDGGNSSDLFYYSETLYMVSDEFNGVLKMNTDGTNQQLINTDKSYKGIFIRNDTIFLAGMGIDIIDMNGEILNQWDMSSDGISEAIDLYVKNDTIYVTGFEENVMLVYNLPSNQAEILTYTVSDATNIEFIDVGMIIRIEISVPQGTDISNLTPIFTLSEGAVAYNANTMEEEVSGVNSHDFSFLPVSYLIEAEDGTQHPYVVFIYEEGIDYEKELISYNIPGQLTNVINQNDATVNITVPQGTNLTNIVAEFELSYGAILTLITNPVTYEIEVQISGETENDYTEPLTLSVFNHLMNDYTDYEITIDYSTSINSFTNEKFVTVYPNPTSKILNLEFTNDNINKLTILNITGKTIIERINIKQNEMIDLSSFECGIYIVKIQTDNEIFTTKIVKE